MIKLIFWQIGSHISLIIEIVKLVKPIVFTVAMLRFFFPAGFASYGDINKGTTKTSCSKNTP